MDRKQLSPRALTRRESPHVDILLDDDIEEPLLPQTEVEEALELGRPSTSAAASAPATVPEPQVQQAPWPALRRSSVSVRKISPVVGFDPNEVDTYLKLHNFNNSYTATFSILSSSTFCT